MFLRSSLANRCLTLLTGGAWLLLAGVSIAHAEGLKINSTFEGGVDAWAITPRKPGLPPVGTDFREGNSLADYDSLHLPDSDTKWNYRSVAPWMRFSSTVRLNTNFEANFKMRADQLLGAHVDVANIDWAPSPYMGLRAGVVNFNTNWCRTYDVDSPWIAEPDAFCRSNIPMRINNAAPGLQAYSNITFGDYQLQNIVGVYRPMLFSYETKEFGFNYLALRENFKRESNRKISAAMNLLNLQTGTQLRLGVMRSEQAGIYSPRLIPNDRARRNLIDNYYLGFDTYLGPTLRFRYSNAQFFSNDYYDDLPVLKQKHRFQNLELIYDWKASDMLALGLSRIDQTASVNDTAFGVFIDDYWLVKTTSQFISWRHQWGKGIHSIIQWTHAAQTNGYFGNRRSGSGDAVGLRLGYQY